MTHLVIENQNSNVEIVNAAIIQKVYEMALSAQGSVSLKGNLQSEHAKQAVYNYLTGNLPNTNTKRFPQLSLNITSGVYIDFEDPVVEQKLATKFGDGIGVTVSDVTGNLNESWGFKRNTNITSFNELGLFTNVTKIANGEYAFYGCTNLQSIDLRNITEIGSSDSQAFRNCTSLISVGNTSNLQIVGTEAFRGCTSLTSIDLSNVTHVGHAAFKECSSLGTNQDLDITLDQYVTEAFYGTAYRSVTLHCTQTSSYDWSGIQSAPFAYMPNLLKLDLSDTKMDKFVSTYTSNLTTLILPTTMTQILWDSFTGINNIQYIVILANNVVSLESADYMLHGVYHPNANVYVPDNLVSQYQGAANWSDISTRIKGISELPSSVTWYTQNNP